MSVVPTSLRGRITAVAVAIVGIVLCIAGLLIFTIQRAQLIQSVDNSLDREGAEIAAALATGESPIIGDRSDERFVQLLRSDNTIAGASAPLLRTTQVINPDTVKLNEDGRQFLSPSQIPIEDDNYRILARHVDAQDEEWLLFVGENTDDLRDNLRVLALALAITVPLATGLLGAVAWLLVSRTLAPVADIERQVTRITGDQLGERVPIPTTRDEIADLATTMNAMLDRINQAHDRQQHFVADASHELRSPITRLRTSLEVDLAAPNRDLNITGHELVQDLQDLQDLIDDLLFLAKAGQPAQNHQPVDLDAVVDQVAAKLAPTTEVRLDTRQLEPVTIAGNEIQLVRLVTNLVANGIRHATTTVQITTNETDSRVELAVHDDGPGIAPEDRARIFERFTRLDESRTSTTGGTGLGLAIAKEIVANHYGHIAAAASALGGASFTVEFTPNPVR